MGHISTNYGERPAEVINGMMADIARLNEATASKDTM